MAIAERRALLVEDHAMTRGLLSDVLRHGGFQVMSAANSAEAISVFDEFDPDVLVADVHLGRRPSGSELAIILATKAPHIAVVLISNYPASHLERQVKAIPAHTVVANKDQVTGGDDLLRVVEAALRNREPVLETDHLSDTGQTEAIGKLTDSQMEVWRFIAAGYSNAQIAQMRGTTTAATERIVTRVFGRLGVDSDSRFNARVAAARSYITLFGPPSLEE